MFADPKTTIVVFLMQGAVFFSLVIFIDWWQTNKFRTIDPVQPGFERPKLKPNSDILIQENIIQTSVESVYLIKAVNLHKTFDTGPKTHAVCGNTIGVKKGVTLGLLGPNGAGKSATFSMLAM